MHHFTLFNPVLKLAVDHHQ